MPADYAIPLKRAWDRMATHPRCGEFCKESPCEGHAALLEMVDAYHLEGCECLEFNEFRGNPVTEHYYRREDPQCVEERRRLRAAVGVEE